MSGIKATISERKRKPGSDAPAEQPVQHNPAHAFGGPREVRQSEPGGSRRRFPDESSIDDPEQGNYLSRVARTQQATMLAPTNVAPPSGEFNVWYGKYCGGREFKPRGGPPPPPPKALSRCEPERDSGKTRADARSGRQCLHFAKGTCIRGADCSYLHRVPTAADDAILEHDPGHDIFGRERFASYRDDMGGVGSVDAPGVTLYIYYGGTSGLATGPEGLDAMEAHFGVWGPLREIYVLPNRRVAFIRYWRRSTAEFAHEAMIGQALVDGGGPLAVKWAREDPNPESQRRDLREAQARAAAAEETIMASLPADHPKRLAVALRDLDAGQYPQTDGRYAAGGDPAAAYAAYAAANGYVWNPAVGWYTLPDVAGAGEAAAGGGALPPEAEVEDDPSFDPEDIAPLPGGKAVPPPSAPANTPLPSKKEPTSAAAAPPDGAASPPPVGALGALDAYDSD